MKVAIQTRTRSQRLAAAAHALNISGQLTTSVHSRLPVTILGMSGVDIRLAAAANPEHGELVTISVPSAYGDGEVTVTGIVHWKEMRGAEHEIGIYLNQKLPRRLEQYCVQSGRQSERYRCRISGRLDFGANRPDCPATVVNYSVSGLAVQCAVPGVIDEVFHFSWLDSGRAKTVSGVALWQIEQNGGYLIGCQLEPGGGRRIAGLLESDDQLV